MWPWHGHEHTLLRFLLWIRCAFDGISHYTRITLILCRFLSRPLNSRVGIFFLFNFVFVCLVGPEFDLKKHTKQRILNSSGRMFSSLFESTRHFYDSHTSCRMISGDRSPSRTPIRRKGLDWWAQWPRSTDRPDDRQRPTGGHFDFIGMSFNYSVSAVVEWIIAAITVEDKDLRTGMAFI